MLLNGANGDRFELQIVRYQFPRLATTYWDANWLQIKIEVSTQRGSWTSTDSSLMTTEAEQLAQWFENIAAREQVERLLEFIEPNLVFEVRNQARERVALRVYFALESRPPWAGWADPFLRDLFVDLDVESSQIAAAAQKLRQQLEQFPTRATEDR